VGLVTGEARFVLRLVDRFTVNDLDVQSIGRVIRT
jgi:hypothetical protein